MARPPQTGSSPRPAPAAGASAPKEQHASEALGELCDGIEREMDELRARYELYFLGVERVEPVRDRATLKQKVARLLTTFTRNAGLRFRVQALHARFVSYERLWDRNARAREDGTYRRDLFKARLRRGERPAAGAEKRPAAEAGAPESAGPSPEELSAALASARAGASATPEPQGAGAPPGSTAPAMAPASGVGPQATVPGTPAGRFYVQIAFQEVKR